MSSVINNIQSLTINQNVSITIIGSWTNHSTIYQNSCGYWMYKLIKDLSKLILLKPQ